MTRVKASNHAGATERAGGADEGAPPMLEARGLTVRFGDVVALDRLDLRAPAGEVLAVLGPNGAGKTTLVRTVATLLRPTAGSLRVQGHDVVADPVAVRRRIGLAGQSAAVEPTMTGRENLEMTARLFGHSRSGARRAAATVAARMGLAEVADRRAGNYSGGQRRRLDLGASLVGAPRLLLLDEPTTGLDPTGRREVWEAVRALVAGGTDVLLTTHYLEEADELADRVVVIDRGRTVASGTAGELKARAGRDVIELRVTEPSGVEGAGRIVQEVTARPAWVEVSTRTVSIPSVGGAGELAAVAGALAGAGVGVEELGLRRPTLDDVFLALTGARHLPTGDAPAGDPPVSEGSW